MVRSHPGDQRASCLNSLNQKRVSEEELAEATNPERYQKEHEVDPAAFFEAVKELAYDLHDCLTARDELREEVASLKAKIVRKDAVIARMTEKNLETLTRPQTESRQTTPGGDNIHRLGKLADPPTFSGDAKSDKLQIDSWIIQVKSKLINDVYHYPNEGRKIAYVQNLLRNPAHQLVKNRLDVDHPHYYQRVTSLFQHLQEIYGNPNKDKDARRDFRKLEMKKDEKFQEFYAEFLRLRAEGNMGAQDQKDELNAKLTWKLQESVAVYYNDDALNSTEFAAKCATIDRQIKERLAKAPKFVRKTSAESADKSLASTKDQKNTRGPSEAVKLVSKPTAYPAQTDVICYNCQETGHISRNCTKPLTKRSREAMTAALEKRFQDQGEITGSEEDDESGKEDL